MHTQPCGTEFSFLSEGWALWYWFLFINICTPSPVALNIPFTQIVRLMVLVSFHKEMHTQPFGTEFSFLSEGWALWYWFLFINKCTPSPVALNFPFSQIVGLMVLVSFHKHMHTQPCGTEYSFHSDCAPYGIGFFS